MGQVLGISSLALLITDSAFSLLRVRGGIQLGQETWEELKCQRSLFQGQERTAPYHSSLECEVGTEASPMKLFLFDLSAC